MCLCVLYLHFCKETWLSVKRVVFEESGTIYPRGTSSTFAAHICWEHLWVIFPIFKRSSNIGTMIVWHRIISFLELKGGTFRDYAVWALPFLWMTKLKRTSSAVRFPASWWRGWHHSQRFLSCLSCFSMRLESLSLCLSARRPCSQCLGEGQIFTYLRLIFFLFTYSVVSNSLWPHGLQHTRLPCPSPSSGTCSNSCPLSWWCHPTISSSVTPFSSCLQSFPASESFPVSWLFASSGQTIGISASTLVLPVNIQDWFPLGLSSWISLLSKGLSRVFSNTTDQKHQIFSTQPSLWSNSHIHTWLLEKP